MSPPVDAQPPDTPGIDVEGRCPACGLPSLFLGAGGYVTCRIAECKHPTSAADLLVQGWALLLDVRMLAERSRQTAETATMVTARVRKLIGDA